MKFILIIFLLIPCSFVFGFSVPDSTKTICTRNLSVNGNIILVKITLEKPALSGFARIYEKLPSGAEVSKVNGGKSIYKNEKSMLKFVWESIPTDQKLEISYEIKLKYAVADTNLAITGTFSAEFLPIETDQISILPGKMEYQKKPVAELAKTEIKTETIKTQTKPEKTSEQPLATAEGVYICIQVAAVGKNIQSDYLKKQFGFEGEFESHYEENIYRITVGKFKSMTEAEAVLKDYKENYFKKCFLSAYKNGNKIPLYEAQKLLN